MNTDQLHCFCVVVERGSFTQAGRQLFLSQPAVSQQVRALENALGVELLDRSRRPLMPTQVGESVYRYGVELLQRVAAIQDVVDECKGLHAGRVTVAAGVVVGHYALPGVIARFRRQHPGVRVELIVEPAASVFEDVLRGTVDFGITLGYHVPAGLVTRSLYQDELVLVVGREHPWSHRANHTLPLQMLALQPLLALRGLFVRARQLYEERLQAAGVEPVPDLEFDSTEPIKQAVATGYGAAFLFRSSIAAELAAGWLHVVAIEGPPLHGDFVVAWRERQHLSPAAQAFLQFAEENISRSEIVHLAGGLPV
jgi:DNA-binding transcriptional LysR family regulator